MLLARLFVILKRFQVETNKCGGSMVKTAFNMGYESKSISDQVCDMIRKLIINKTIPSGERLVETKIAKDLAVSITPVRHAFGQLANEGLLTVYQFKGTYVTQITSQYVLDVINTRKILEPGAANLCFDKFTSKDVQILKDFTRLSDEYCSKGNIFEATEADLNYHGHFFEICENELLQEMWRVLRTRIQYIQSYTKPKIRPVDYLSKRHAGMINAIIKKDKGAFISSLIEHIDTSYDLNSYQESC